MLGTAWTLIVAAAMALVVVVEAVVETLTTKEAGGCVSDGNSTPWIGGTEGGRT